MISGSGLVPDQSQSRLRRRNGETADLLKPLHAHRDD